MGCTLEVALEGEQVLTVEGQGCKRGIAYATDETSNPRRVVTTTVTVSSGVHPLLPVYTERPIPKARMAELVAALSRVQVIAPIKAGQVVMEDALGTGVQVLASRDIARLE
jgi:CxxC motif-containing protein